jgi:ADP-ribose pyrophosphatase YjhB (NUDIX family)
MYAFRFCPDCGAQLPELQDADRVLAQTCNTCSAIHWRNAKPCAGALVVSDGRVLLGRRAVEPARGAWDIPGGFLEPWELPQHAAAREVLEETGLVVETDDDPFIVVIDRYADRDYTLNLYYRAEIVGGSPRPADDLAELHWFAPGELPTDLAFAHCAEVLNKWRCATS